MVISSGKEIQDRLGWQPLSLITADRHEPRHEDPVPIRPGHLLSKIIAESSGMFKSFPVHTILSISLMRFSIRCAETGNGVFSSCAKTETLYSSIIQANASTASLFSADA